MGPPIKGAVKCREIGHFTVHLAYKPKNFSTAISSQKWGQNRSNQENQTKWGWAGHVTGRPYKGC